MRTINLTLYTSRSSQGAVLDNIVAFAVELLRKIYSIPITYNVVYDEIDIPYLLIDNMPPLYLYDPPEIDTLINIVRAVYDIYSLEPSGNDIIAVTEA